MLNFTERTLDFQRIFLKIDFKTDLLTSFTCYLTPSTLNLVTFEVFLFKQLITWRSKGIRGLPIAEDVSSLLVYIDFDVKCIEGAIVEEIKQFVITTTPIFDAFDIRTEQSDH